MRPSLLDAYFSSATGVRGVGPRLGKLLGKLLRPSGDGLAGDARLVDLLFHLPSGLIDRSYRPLIADLPQHGIVTILITVGRHRPPPPHNKRVPYRIEAFDDSGSLVLAFFHAYPDYLKKALPEGSERYVSGAIDWYGGLPQMVHPDHIVAPEDFAKPAPYRADLSGHRRRGPENPRQVDPRSPRNRPAATRMARPRPDGPARLSGLSCRARSPAPPRPPPTSSIPQARHADALPMTNCCRASWRCRSSAAT